MDHQNNEHRQSSLPESLRPHLYDGPRETEAPPTQQFQPSLPLTVPGPSEDPMRSTDSARAELPPIRSSFQLPSMASSLLRPLSEDSRTLPPPHYTARPLSMRETSFTSRPPTDIPPSAIAHPTGAMSLPTLYGQHFASAPPPEPAYIQGRYVESRYPTRDPGLTLPAPRPTSIHRTSWLEGEAGPSSLLHTSHSFDGYRGRRGSSQPAQMSRHSDLHAHRGVSDDEYEMTMARSRGSGTHEISRPESYSPQYGQNANKVPTQAPHTERLPYTSRDSPPYHLPPMRHPNRTWSGTPTPGYPYGEPAAGQSPGSFSEMSSEGGVTEEGADDNASTRSKRRKQEDEPKPQEKEKSTRKTAVACNFCRGRKLRCNGAKPSCSNCILRKFECEYVPVQRRRGPGKAPKGSKSKKNTTGQQPVASTSMTDLGATEASGSLSAGAARGRSLQPEDPTTNNSSSRRRRRAHASQPPSSPERDTDGEK